ncbi:PTS transporter subunit EIIB, partial [Burkholderia multivorans]|uniref:PTS transporter subunit EIIB n=1 Tax=Burkholderia multivorans TaxID=87883 RepID=UPI0021601683
AAAPRAQRYIAALGGAGNLSVVDACTTRLRLTVVDPAKVSEPELKSIAARISSAMMSASGPMITCTLLPPRLS